MASDFNIFVPFHHTFLLVSSGAPTYLVAYTAPGTLYDTWYNALHTVRLIIRPAGWYTLPNTTQYTTSYAAHHTPYTVRRASHTTHDTSYIKHDTSHTTRTTKKKQINNKKKTKKKQKKTKKKQKKNNGQRH